MNASTADRIPVGARPHERFVISGTLLGWIWRSVAVIHTVQTHLADKGFELFEVDLEITIRVHLAEERLAKALGPARICLGAEVHELVEVDLTRLVEVDRLEGKLNSP